MSLLDVKKWSSKAELVTVLLAAFGWFSLSSLLWLTVAPDQPVLMSDEGFRYLLLYEGIVLIGLGRFLYLRGWTWARVGLVPAWRSTLEGVALAAATYAVVLVVYLLVPQPASRDLQVADVGVSTIVAVSTLNPLFEELFVCGYLVTVVKAGRGAPFAVNASTALRLLYHLYQGPAAVLSILPVGFVFAYYYARTGRLWPLVVAHALFDGLSLLALNQTTIT